MNIEQFEKSLTRAKDKQVRKLREGVKKAAEFILRRSLEYVPVQTGELKRSAYVREERSNKNEVEWIIGYRTPYAVYVHERLDLAHGREFNRKHAMMIAFYGGNHPFYFNRKPEEQAKFLERVLRIYRAEIDLIIKRETSKKS